MPSCFDQLLSYFRKKPAAQPSVGRFISARAIGDEAAPKAPNVNLRTLNTIGGSKTRFQWKFHRSCYKQPEQTKKKKSKISSLQLEL